MTTATTTAALAGRFTLPAIADNLTAYINAVRSIPLLSEEEERELARRLRQDNDIAAARKLALANLRLVVSVANHYDGYGLDKTDLIQEGNIGLMKAVQKYDPNRGARLATFAVYWIRAEIHEFVIRNWRIVRIATTKAQRKLFFHMHKLTRAVAGRSADNAAVAAELKVKPEEVEDMRARLYQTDRAAFFGDDETSPGAEAVIADPRADADPEQQLEAQCRRRVVADALSTIGAREKDIIQCRRLQEPPQTLQSLAGKHGISVERVRQIEQSAMKKIAAFIKDRLSLPSAA